MPSYWRRRIPRDFLVRAGVCHVPLLSNVLLRRPLAILAVLYGVCAFAAGQQKDAPVAALEFATAWSRSYPTLKEQRVSLALSDGARCTAIAGGGEVEVLDAAGQGGGRRWGGRGEALKFRLGVALRGGWWDGGGRLCGEEFGKRGFGVRNAPFWGRGLRTDGSVVWTGACNGVVRADGSVVWTGAFGAAPWTIGMNASRDLRTFVSWEGYPHSPDIGQVRMLDESGKQLWRKFSEDPAAVVTPAGDKIVARFDVDQDLQETQEPLEMKLQVLSRDGALLKDFPNVDGKPIAISPDGERVLIQTQAEIEGIDLNGTRLFAIALNPTAYRIVLVAEDFSGILVFSRGTDSQLRWYKVK